MGCIYFSTEEREEDKEHERTRRGGLYPMSSFSLQPFGQQVEEDMALPSQGNSPARSSFQLEVGQVGHDQCVLQAGLSG